MVFNQVSADGYIADRNGDMSWAHKHDPEWTAFVSGNASGGGTLLFGRVTYQMMASYWPTPQAAANMPVVAERMNALPKIVFSRTLQDAPWNNTKLLKGGLAEEVRAMKESAGEDIVILGSASIVSQLARAALIDEYQMVVNPVVLGAGKSMFAGLDKRLDLRLVKSRIFSNGNVLLCYEA
jgi:dihydrofolate reductase